ncbi:HAAS signaling domain-containing protein [Paractinoplanes maris]|uniref:HAAS signaling domain-containing protein n=1 Tax=Paractinoplanes maris TaxID=1734446 RepID=UPI0020227E35|nr:hypothetical protein [Actinoplanes maris]
MTAAARLDGGPVDRYLDEMFDLLSGTGADGRRLLTEAEEHLAEAAAEGRSRGLDAEAAEREAVQRFGAAAAVARRVPATAGPVRVSLRRLATVAWALTGLALTWFGLSGALTWLLSGPWTRLLIATDRFGGHPMCEGPWMPPFPIDCVEAYRQDVALLPGVGNDFPYQLVGGLGVALVVALLILRRITALGAPSWTPSRTVPGLVFAVLFGLTGVALLIEAIDGVFKEVQYYVVADLVAGLLAVTIGAVVVRRSRIVQGGQPTAC